MENVRVNKSEILDVLKKNRETHRKIFLEALTGYRETAIKLLEEKLALARSGKRIELSFRLTQPMDQTSDYDRAIRMLEMSINQDIELSEHDFENYVMDNWDWKRQFLSSNSAYSSTAMGFLGQEHES